MEERKEENGSSQTRPRNQRAINEIGRAEKVLFGIATTGDITRISDTLGTIIQTQGDMIVAADHSTVILKSHTKNIRTVAHAVIQLQTLVMNVTSNIKSDIGDQSLIAKMLSNNLYTQSGHVIYTRSSLILQDLDTNLQITHNGLNQASLGKFTMDILDPKALTTTLEYWEETAFAKGEQFLWGHESTKDILQYYIHG